MEETEEQKEPIYKIILETILKCIYIIIIIFSLMTTIYTIGFENTYCKITRNIAWTEAGGLNGITEYKPLQVIRNTETGYYKTIYGLGVLRIANETTYKNIECKTKYLKRPLINPNEIKTQIFGE